MNVKLRDGSGVRLRAGRLEAVPGLSTGEVPSADVAAARALMTEAADMPGLLTELARARAIETVECAPAPARLP